MWPVEAGINVRKTARYAGEECDPLHFDLADPQKVSVRLTWQVLDENYTRLLLSQTDLELLDVVALDKVQKKRPLDDESFRRLKAQKLIEGRRKALDAIGEELLEHETLQRDGLEALLKKNS